jgi:secreted trypsin-like serine protease
MSADQRKVYNQKRYTPKRKRDDQAGPSTSGITSKPRVKNEEFDALSSLEREVMKRTQQAQQTLMRQRQQQQVQQNFPPVTSTILQVPTSVTFSNTPGNTQSVGAHLMQQQQQNQSTPQMQFY